MSERNISVRNKRHAFLPFWASARAFILDEAPYGGASKRNRAPVPVRGNDLDFLFSVHTSSCSTHSHAF